MNTLKADEAALEDPSDMDAAYAFCVSLAASRCECFPVASRIIERRLRKHVAALYAFARLAEDFADGPDDAGVRAERLLDWRRQLREAARGLPARHPVFVALAGTIKELELPVELFDDLLSAFLQDVAKKRYGSFDEILDYCRLSANPAGRLVLLIHGYREPELFRYSDAVCTALRLAGFWRDLSADLKKDRVYIPEEDFKAFGYSEADLLMGVVNERFRGLMKFELNRTRALFEQGRPLSGKLRWPLSWAVRLAWRGGCGILRKIRRAGFDTLSARPRLTRWDWIPLAARSLLQP